MLEIYPLLHLLNAQPRYHSSPELTRAAMWEWVWHKQSLSSFQYFSNSVRDYTFHHTVKHTEFMFVAFWSFICTDSCLNHTICHLCFRFELLGLIKEGQFTDFITWSRHQSYFGSVSFCCQSVWWRLFSWMFPQSSKKLQTTTPSRCG